MLTDQSCAGLTQVVIVAVTSKGHVLPGRLWSTVLFPLALLPPPSYKCPIYGWILRNLLLPVLWALWIWLSLTAEEASLTKVDSRTQRTQRSRRQCDQHIVLTWQQSAFCSFKTFTYSKSSEWSTIWTWLCPVLDRIDEKTLEGIPQCPSLPETRVSVFSAFDDAESMYFTEMGFSTSILEKSLLQLITNQVILWDYEFLVSQQPLTILLAYFFLELAWYLTFLGQRSYVWWSC